MPGQYRLQLAGMAEGELPQQGSDRRRCIHAVEQRPQSTAADRVDVVDTVRARAHPRHHGRQLGCGVRRTGLDPRRTDVDPLREQAPQTGLLGQPHHRHQPGIRHEVIVIKDRRTRAEPVRHLHRQCLSELDRLLPENFNHPSSEGTFPVPTPNQHQVRRWIEAKPFIVTGRRAEV